MTSDTLMISQYDDRCVGVSITVSILVAFAVHILETTYAIARQLSQLNNIQDRSPSETRLK